MIDWEKDITKKFGSKYVKRRMTQQIFEIIGPHCNDSKLYAIREMNCGQFGEIRAEELKNEYFPVQSIETEVEEFVPLEIQPTHVSDNVKVFETMDIRNSGTTYGTMKKVKKVSWEPIEINCNDCVKVIDGIDCGGWKDGKCSQYKPKEGER